MKKWYRIYEVIDGQPSLVDNSQANWYSTEKDAELMVLYAIHQNGGLYTILPVYEKADY